MSKELNNGSKEVFTSTIKPSREVGKKSFKKKVIYRPKFKHPLKEI